MSSHHQHFQPPPPIRTATSGSQKSHLSGTISPDMLSPTSTCSRSPRSPTSPAEESFFSAITSRIRGRSRSRSRAAASRNRSKSPLIMPPEHLPSTSSRTSATPFTAPSRPQQQSRHISTASQGSMGSPSQPTRPSLQKESRRSTSSSSDMWRGRHSNSWLFNDFSVTEQAKGLIHRRRK